jgi:hypothetical protein
MLRFVCCKMCIGYPYVAIEVWIQYKQNSHSLGFPCFETCSCANGGVRARTTLACSLDAVSFCSRILLYSARGQL